MVRIRSIVLGALTGGSLLLCLASAAAWVRSYYYRDLLSWTRSTSATHISQSIRGAIHDLTSYGAVIPGPAAYQCDRLSSNAIWNGGMSSYPIQPEFHAGFIYQRYSRSHMSMGFGQSFVTKHRLVVIPWYAPTLLFALLPIAAAVRWMYRRREITPGQCRVCGYDLRATPNGCPECGTEATATRAR